MLMPMKTVWVGRDGPFGVTHNDCTLKLYISLFSVFALIQLFLEIKGCSFLHCYAYLCILYFFVFKRYFIYFLPIFFCCCRSSTVVSIFPTTTTPPVSIMFNEKGVQCHSWAPSINSFKLFEFTWHLFLRHKALPVGHLD